MILVKISQNFFKSPLKNCLISQISVHSLWHVWFDNFGSGAVLVAELRFLGKVLFGHNINVHTDSLIQIRCPVSFIQIREILVCP